MGCIRSIFDIQTHLRRDVESYQHSRLIKELYIKIKTYIILINII